MTDFHYTDIARNGVDFTSDAIRTLAFNGNDHDGALYVEFHSGGKYVYDEVAESTYNLFKSADSLGHFWRQHMSGNYYQHDDFEDGVGDLIPVSKSYDPSDPEDFTTGAGDPVTQPEFREFAHAAPAPTMVGLDPVTGDDLWSVPASARYGVTWRNEDNGLTHEPLFDATSEADALVQFNAALAEANRLGVPFSNVKIVSVTHYFE